MTLWHAMRRALLCWTPHEDPEDRERTWQQFEQEGPGPGLGDRHYMPRHSVMLKERLRALDSVTSFLDHDVVTEQETEFWNTAKRLLEHIDEAKSMSEMTFMMGRSSFADDDDAEAAAAISRTDSMGHADSNQDPDSFVAARRAAGAVAPPKPVLFALIQQLQGKKLPDHTVVMQVIHAFQELLHVSCGPLVHVPRPRGRLIIVGDLHGHHGDLVRLLATHGDPTPDNQYLFNGDFVDRGVWGPEVVLYIFCLKLLYPEDVYLNRGNHESVLCTEAYGFQTQLHCSFPDHWESIYEEFHEAFNLLPLCHVIDKTVCVIHGGLPRGTPKAEGQRWPTPPRLDEIARLPRSPCPWPGGGRADRIFQALLWSDPKDEEGPSTRGLGWHFSEETTRRFLEANDLQFIIRSHECIDTGWQVTHSGRVATVFSASNYNETNYANVCVIDAEMNIECGTKWQEQYLKPEIAEVYNEMDDWDRDEWLRKISVAEWNDASGYRDLSVKVLKKRGGLSKDQWASAKEQVLKTLRSMIWINRHRLVHAFSQEDMMASQEAEGGESSNGLTGSRSVDGQKSWSDKITPHQWAAAMQTSLRTPFEFPWDQICPHLCDLDEDGNISYFQFICRYHNPFFTWLTNRFIDSYLEWLLMVFDGNPIDEFNKWPKSKNGKMHYREMAPFMESYMGMAQPETEVEAVQRQVMFVMFFARINEGTDNGTYISAEDFGKVFESIDQTGKETLTCKRGHQLTRRMGGGTFGTGVGPTGSQNIMLAQYSSRGAKACNDCQAPLNRTEKQISCVECSDFFLCRNCVWKRRGLDWAVDLAKRWGNVELALHVLCASHANVSFLFKALARKLPSEMVDKATFVELCKKQLRMDERWQTIVPDVWQGLYDYLHDLGVKTEELNIKHVAACLRVMDKKRTDIPEVPKFNWVEETGFEEEFEDDVYGQLAGMMG